MTVVSQTLDLERVLTEDNLLTLSRVLDVLRVANNKYGLLDVVHGVLEDEETVAKLVNTLTSDKVLGLSDRLDNVIDLVDYLTREDTVLALKDVLDLVKTLGNTGLLDPIKGMLSDEDFMSAIGNLVSSDFMINFLANFKQIVDDLGKLDLTNFKYYTLLVNETGEAIKTRDIKPIKSVFELLKLFKDPEVQVGLGVVVAVLRHIGRYHMKHVGGNSQAGQK
ncbi:MAG: DUF1641 domain-containing protein [Sulfolobaceae archaeon]|nr:DUF1641 domain-containing protein [Sulfolobales archaeon]